MKLIQQLLEVSKQQKVPTNNFVAKHSQQKTGAGQHEAKQGNKASRARQKKQWKKETY